MHITQYTDYALRVLLFLAEQPERATIADIAARHNISRSHLMKVVNQLVQEGFVLGTRGKGGGITLARAPQDIVIGDVVRRIEGDFTLVECFGADNRCCIASACQLKSVLGQALQAFLTVLNRYTLADLMGEPGAMARLLPTPLAIVKSGS